MFINARTFSDLAGITPRRGRRALSRAYEGLSWRDHQLIVRRIKAKGGQSGWQYEVRADSLPAELRKSLPVVQSTDSSCRIEVEDFSEIPSWRYEVIKAALRTPLYSPERMAAIAAAARVARPWPTGAYRKVSERAIRNWIAAYGQHGMAGLKPARRSDRGKTRVFISRGWDKAVPFPESVREKIADAMLREIRSLWAANTSYGWRWVARLGWPTLSAHTIEAGFDPGRSQLEKICALPRSFVERGREYRQLAIYDKDRKRYFDKSLPRIRRTREGRKPMEVVIGDVHHLDVLLKRPDGSTFTPKIVSWLDWATNRIFCYPIFLEKREGIRQEHVIEAYIAMATDSRWGVPELLYLDNGGEYYWAELIDDAQKLSTQVRNLGDDGTMEKTVAHRRSSIVKALPYNAPAKAIEGIFGVLESGTLSMLPGWIGGNRMKKKTANVGKDPVPYPGGQEAFRKSLAVMIEAYETHPQGGTLRNRSPRAVFAEAVEGGWERMDIDPRQLRTVFARPQKRTINQGGFSLGGEHYTHRKIQQLSAGTKVIVRVPIVGDREELPVLTSDGKFLCIASRDVGLDVFDARGAREAAERQKQSTRRISEMRRDVDSIDSEERVKRLVALSPEAPTPQSGGTIKLSADFEKIARALSKPLQDYKEDEKRRAKRKDKRKFEVAERYIANLQKRRATGV